MLGMLTHSSIAKIAPNTRQLSILRWQKFREAMSSLVLRSFLLIGTLVAVFDAAGCSPSVFLNPSMEQAMDLLSLNAKAVLQQHDMAFLASVTTGAAAVDLAASTGAHICFFFKNLINNKHTFVFEKVRVEA
jgi:hypothetical protein